MKIEPNPVCLHLVFYLAGIRDPRYKIGEARASSHEGHPHLQRSRLPSKDAHFSQGTGQTSKQVLSGVITLLHRPGKSYYPIYVLSAFSFISAPPASDCGHFLRGGLAAVPARSGRLAPRRLGRVHPHRDPAAEGRPPDPRPPRP